jgi:prepilin-type N-terminal cleavage/methylation domain-containing protein
MRKVSTPAQIANSRFSGEGIVKKIRNAQAGFSLIEVVIAMGILAIGILGVAPMILFNVKANASGKNYGIANYLAQQRLEQIRSWPLWEDYDANSPGITTANTALFGAETNIKVGEHYEGFNRTTEMVRNGYTGSYGCGGNPFIFATSGGTYSEGNIPGGGSLNTGTTAGEYCGSGSNYRGEDFKVIRVKVTWADLFGNHEINRYMYIAKF